MYQPHVWVTVGCRLSGQGEETSAQAAARAAFAQDRTDGFYSSDDDDTHSSASLSTTTSNAGPKFKVCLRHTLACFPAGHAMRCDACM